MSVSVNPLPHDPSSDDKSHKKSSAISDDDLVILAAKAAELAESYGSEIPSAASTQQLEDRLKVVVKPVNPTMIKTEEANVAADLIRAKLSKLYNDEPDAEIEAKEVEAAGPHRSVHQQYMYELTTSGLSLADIQTKWHEYYVALLDDQKHEVWQEFYDAQRSIKISRQNKKSESKKSTKKTNIQPKKHGKVHPEELPDHIYDDLESNSSAVIPPKVLQPLFTPREPEKRSVDDIKSAVINRVSGGGLITPVQHAKSLLFGLGLASFVVLIMLFTFFNQAFVVPFISPSSTVSATPIIGNIDGPVGPEAKIIIPKINLEVPVVYGLNTVAESSIQNALEEGVVHYAASSEPGQQGNSVIVGHSSNNILNSGKYKFAFVLLNRLESEDVFYIHKNGIRYAYKVYEKKIVSPNDISVLGPATRASSMTLITCDPPGTSKNRLIIIAEQISPDPSGNAATEISIDAKGQETVLPSNAPSLWSRLIGLF